MQIPKILIEGMKLMDERNKLNNKVKAYNKRNKVDIKEDYYGDEYEKLRLWLSNELLKIASKETIKQ